MRSWPQILVLAVLSLFMAATPANAQQGNELTWDLLANGDQVGYIKANLKGKTLDVDYHVDNNGRGPKHHATVVLGEQSIPLSWSIQGTTLMGSAVDERFEWHDGVARWRSQAGQGEATLPAPRLYVVNESSPWALWVYARALLAAPQGKLPVLPSGFLRAEVVDRFTLQADSAADGVPVRLLRLSGLTLEPRYLMLDEQGHLFAGMNDGTVAIREGHRSLVPNVLGILSEQKQAYAQSLQQQLMHDVGAGLWIRNVHVFDPISGQRRGPVNVHMVKGHIVSVGEQWHPRDEEAVYDGAGGTLIPGLHDMHSHSSLLSGLWYLAAGVTSTRDMGNRNPFLLELIAQIDQGDIAGPRISRNGFLEARSPYSASMGKVAESLDQALDAVRWYDAHGYAQIKLYNSMKPEWVGPISELAHSLGMTVTGHVPAFTNADAMIKAGYDEIAHVNQLMLGWVLEEGEDTRTPLRLTAMKRVADLNLDSQRVRRTVQLMQRHGVALNTTAVILERLMLSRSGMVLEADKPYLSHMPISYQRYRRRTYVPDLTPQTDQQYREALDKVLALIGMLHDQGVTLLPGTDDTTGFTVHRELELYVRAGLEPAEALRVATWQCEVQLGRTAELGSIHPGKRADVVLLPGNPLEDISAIRTPSLVVKGHQLYLPAEIYQALGVMPFAPPPRKTQ